RHGQDFYAIRKVLILTDFKHITIPANTKEMYGSIVTLQTFVKIFPSKLPSIRVYQNCAFKIRTLQIVRGLPNILFPDGLLLKLLIASFTSSSSSLSSEQQSRLGRPFCPVIANNRDYVVNNLMLSVKFANLIINSPRRIVINIINVLDI
ncbi:hypothetical protein L9F63_002148, partial [Diploptera punctata]